MAARIFALAAFIFRTRGAMAGGEEDCSASEGAPVQASALLQAASQRGPKTQLVDARHLEIDLETEKKVDEALWDLFKNNRQCGKWNDAQNRYPGTASREECQAKAIENGHAFFTYRASQKKCQTSADCDNERGGSGWKIYAAPETAEGSCVVSSVTVFTGSEPTQISWKIAGQAIGGQIQHCIGEDYTSADGEVTVDCCLSSGTFLLSCKDDSGNGMSGGYVKVGGHRLFDPWSGFKQDAAVTILQPASDASDGCVVSTLSIFTGQNPTRVQWKIVGKSEGGEMVTCNGGDYSTGDEDLTTECCLSPGAYLLTCMDNSGDGWIGGFIEFGGHTFCHSWTGFDKDVLLIA